MKHIAMITLFAAGALSANAQELEVIGSAGSSETSASGTLSYTIGEVVVATGSSTENVLTQGFHQGFLTPTAIDEVPERFEVTIYPNPTADRLVIESAHLSDFERVKLYDLQGKLIWQQASSLADQERMVINFIPYAAGNYILRMSEKTTGEVYSYKVVKGQ